MVEAAAAFVAWLGVSLVVLSDARRGLALGTLLAAVGLEVMTGEGAALRFAVMSGVGLAGARALSSADTSVAQTAFAVLALAVAAGAALGADAGVWPFLAGAGAAVAATWAPGRVQRAA